MVDVILDVMVDVIVDVIVDVKVDVIVDVIIDGLLNFIYRFLGPTLLGYIESYFLLVVVLPFYLIVCLFLGAF
jgi:hypothetical protein